MVDVAALKPELSGVTMRLGNTLAVLGLGTTACFSDSSPDRVPASADGGTLVISTGGDPDLLLPPLTSTVQGKIVNDLVYDHLAEIGDSLNTVGDAGFAPRLARNWKWAGDSMSISFSIDPLARWHDGRPVHAADVRFTHRLYSDSATGSPFASLITNIDSVSAPDSLTAVVWFKSRSPMQFFDAVSQMSILPQHAIGEARGPALRTAASARAPMGSGRYRFVRWREGNAIELAADTANYRGRPHIDRVILTIAPDFNTALTRVLGGEADLLEQVPAANLAQIAANPNVKRIPLPGLEYNFVQFNLRNPRNRSRPHPLFGDRALRRALTQAVDRRSIVLNAYDSLALPAVGPTVRAYPTTDTALRQIPYSPDAARRTLDSLGWRDRDGDGIRERNGRSLEFTLTVPNVSKARLAMAVLIQDQMKQVGAKLNVDRSEMASFVDRATRRDFDAVFWGWKVEASPGSIRQTWGTPGSHAGSGSNYGSYENPAFDALVDSALAAAALAVRRAHFTAAYQAIIDDAPAIWMAEPRRIMAIHRRIRTTGMRPDAWWANIGEWSIPPGDRIPRDRVAPPL